MNGWMDGWMGYVILISHEGLWIGMDSWARAWLSFGHVGMGHRRSFGVYLLQQLPSQRLSFACFFPVQQNEHCNCCGLGGDRISGHHGMYGMQAFGGGITWRESPLMNNKRVNERYSGSRCPHLQDLGTS